MAVSRVERRDMAWTKQARSSHSRFRSLTHVQGRGHGRTLLNYCEEFAKKRSYTSIRLDAFAENSTELQFYERHGYIFRGEVRFAFKPVGHQRYCCYEKSLM
jgi:ribosomal protein S18 acetylase RimI-like enzyme